MAEHYGVKPKAFTKEWWPYFWMYYKWHTIGTLAVILAVLFTVEQCVTKPKYDLTMTYAGHLTFTDEQQDKIRTDFNSWINDVDGNGENNIYFQCLSFLDNAGSEEYDAAMQSKLDMELYDDQSFLYIVDKQTLESILNNSYREDVYENVSDWTTVMPSEDRLYVLDNIPFAVSLADSTYMKQNGYNSSDMYMLVKKNYKSSELNDAAYKESLTIANRLIN